MPPRRWSYLRPGPNRRSARSAAGSGNLKRNRLLALESLEERALLAMSPTLTSLSIPAASALVGQPLQFTANVTEAGASSVVLTGGSVTFHDGEVCLGTAPLVAGKASLVNSLFAAGVQTVTASYSGDGAEVAGSTSLAQSLLVNNGNSGAAGVAPFAMPCYISSSAGASPMNTAAPTGMTPTQICQAYGFSGLTFGSQAANGAGETIAIVDAYDDPNIASDLTSFDSYFGLAAPPSFTKVNETGGSSLPAANSGWITEIALDVEWSHAVAPGANILLVEANSNSDTDLDTAVSYASHAAGVVAVSMSWGGGEYSGETAEDSCFTTPSGHAGVTFLASSGDGGAPPIYPSISPNVVSVGGTSLYLTAQNNYSSESGWSGSGGGISSYETQPAYQKGVVTQSTTRRTDPDVSYDANPSTGFPVYDSYNNGTVDPWGQWGGTSDASPQWAALVAIADQGRALAGKSSLDGPTQTLPLLYELPQSDFHDVTSGGSTGNPAYSCGPGYDLVTGRGTPYANQVINALASATFTTTTLSESANTITYGQSVTLTATVAVTQGTGTPSGGTVTFLDSGTAIGSATLSNGTASFTTTTLGYGVHQLTASYSGYGVTYWPSSTPAAGLTSVSIITTVAGEGVGDGAQATAATLNSPCGEAVDSAGDLFIADTNDNRIREINHATGVITTVAGTGTAGYSGDNGPAAAAELSAPNAVALDSSGNLYIADTNNGRIRKVNLSTGVITTVAGNGIWAYSGDNGPATAAEIYYPEGLALDSSGNLYIADTDNNRIREVNHSTGAITTVAGTGTAGYNSDNIQATAAYLNDPTGVAVDSSGNLYIADYINNRIRKVTASSGLITTVAGTGTAGYSGNNIQATAAYLDEPRGVALDSSGDLFIADYYNERIREVNASSGLIATVAGNGSYGFSGDGGAATAAMMRYPKGVVVDTSGNVYIADSGNNRIREVNYSTGAISTFAGGFVGDGGSATAAVLGAPFATAVDAAGDIFIADTSDNRIREVNHATGAITTVAGSGTAGFSGDNGQATAAMLAAPHGVAVDSAGNVYIADSSNSRVREVNHVTGVITTIAGDGVFGYSGDGGAATAAALYAPYGLALDGRGDLFIDDYENQRIREVNLSSGLITTIAGGGVMDGQPASSAPLYQPEDVAIDSAGNLYIADSEDNRVREVNHSTGVITTIAGNGVGGYSGDNGQATAAELSDPYAIALDSSGNLYITDTGNNRIRKVNLSSGAITTIAGNGVGSYSGDNGQATAAEINYPEGLTLDGRGDLFISDTDNNRVRELKLATGVITTAAGTGMASYSGDGSQATAATLNHPMGLAADSAGDLYISDMDNSRIREVNAASGAIATVAGNGTTGFSGDNGAATAAELYYPIGVLVDASGDLFIADFDNQRVREVYASSGKIATVAGDGSYGFNGDGVAATAAELADPRNMALDSAGNLYIADTSNDRIREVNVSTGLISTVAGNGSSHYGGDGGAASVAVLYYPQGIAVDSQGNLYIADSDNDRIREVNISTGVITTVAGDGTGGYLGDNGPATAANLNWPQGVAVDAAGDIYIADYINNRIRVVNASTGVISTFAGISSLGGGTQSQGFAGDGGPVSAAVLDDSSGVTIDSSGNLYIADSGNNRVREVAAGGLTLTVNPTAASSTTITFASPAATTYGGSVALSATLLCGGVPVSGESIAFTLDGSLLGTAVSGAAGVATISAASVAGCVPGTYSGYLGASFSGTAMFGVSNATANLTVTQAPLTIAANSTTKLYGAADPAFTATYTGFVSGEGPANLGGTLLFTTNEPASGYAPAASYTISPSGLTSGNYAITFLPGTLTVNPAATTTVLSASTTSDVYGQSVTLTVTVTAAVPSAAIPSGGITFMDGGKTIGTASLSGGTAVLNTTSLAAGTHSLSAVYGGGANFVASNSDVLSPATTISTVAGGYLGDNGSATASVLNSPENVACDAAGDLFIADTDNNRIREVNVTTGAITTVAGNGISGHTGDNGPATAAELDLPFGVAVDSSGHLFIVDQGDNRVREVNLSSGVITTIAGNGTEGYSGDGGQASAAVLANPAGIAVDSSGHVFIADMFNARVREINLSTGVITTVAGNGNWGYGGDNGQATAAELYVPQGVAVDGSGHLFIADTDNERIRAVNLSTGVITTVAGSGSEGYGGDNGQATAASLNEPYGVSVDTSGHLFITDTINARIREVNLSTGVITTVAGDGFSGSYGDGGQATVAQIGFPESAAVDANGHLFIADARNNRVRQVNLSTGVISTFAGSAYSGNNGPATAAALSEPEAIAVDAAGDIFIADSANYRVREVNAATGVITTVAGDGTQGYSGDNGQATAAELNFSMALAVDNSGHLFIADSDNQRIREVNLSTGVITTVAGNGMAGYNGDGSQATAAEIYDPNGLTVDNNGDLFIGDTGNARIREVNLSTGVITTIAGTGTWGYSGNGGPATAAELNAPQGLALNSSGDLFFADSNNNIVREINLASGVITTVAGVPLWQGYNGDGGQATAAVLGFPVAVAVDAYGDLFISDYSTSRVREVNLSTGIISTVAGGSAIGYGGDGGLATAAELYRQGGLALDSSGNLYVADTYNDRVRKLTLPSLSLNVSPAPLTVTANNLSKVYGAALPTLTASYWGFVNGDTAASLTTAPTLSTTATAASQVSNYTITAGGAADPNYTISYVSGTLTVTPAPLTITANNPSKLYGATLPSLTASYAGFVNGDTPASLTTAPTLATTATAASHVSGNPYTVSASGAVDPDYTFSYVAGTLTVTPVPLTITANNQSKLYGAALPNFSASYSGFVNGDTSASLTTGPTFTTTATAASHVAGNPYAISAAGAVDADYSISYVAGALTITPAPLTITANNQTKLYGAALPSLTASYAGFVNGDSPTSLSTGPTLSTTATAASHVAGSPYTISATGAVDADYSISYVAGALTVTPAPLTVTANNQTMLYGAALPTLSASYAGFVNGDSSASLTTAPTLTTTATAASHVAGNPYTISATGAVDADYSISYVAGALTVTPAPLTVTANIQSKLYGAALPNFSASYSGFVNGDTSASLTTAPTLTTTATAASHVAGNPYTISAAGAVDADYSISYVTGALTVTPAPLTITAVNQSTLYGAALPLLTANYAGFVNGDSSASLTTAPTLTTTATAASHVAGSPYTISASGAGDPDYSISYVAGALTVTPVPLTITANNQTKLYGAALPALAASYAGFVNGDSSASFSTAPTFSTTATAASPTGSYAITVGGAADADYTITYVSAALTINPEPLTITAVGGNKVYGTADPAFAVSYCGFIPGDGPANLGGALLFTTDEPAGNAPVGTYTVAPSGLTSTNYAISFAPGTFTVSPAPLIVMANSTVKTYGSADPAFSATYAGFAPGDNPGDLGGTLSFTTNEPAGNAPAGSYTIAPSGLTSANYTITDADAVLLVAPAPLTITAVSQSKPYGAALPALGVNYSGLVNGDTAASLSAAPSVTTAATAASSVGSYVIAVSGAVDPNYAISYAFGSLTVTPAPLTVTANNQSKVYGAADPALSYAVSGTFYNGDGPSVVSGVSLATAAGATATVGTHAITATGGTAANYAITDLGGTLAVTPAPLTITADNQGKVYGAPDPALTFTPSGTLYFGDQYSVISGVSLATATGRTATVGTHAITVTGGTAANYAVTDLGGTLTVTPAPLTVTANNQGKVYGAIDPTLTYTPSGTLYYGDQYSVISGVSLSTATGAAATMGTHAVTASGGTAANYAVTDVGATLTVTPAPLTVTADNQGKVYGASDPTLTYTPSGTLYYGDQYSVISGVSLSAATGAAATVGTHAITASGGTAADYAVTDLSGTLTVTPAPLSVTANNQSMVYGASNPLLTYTPSGTLYYGDQYSVIGGVSLVTATGAAATVGTHAITASGGTAANYSIADVSGTLTVTPAPLTVIADNQSKVYGASDPALSYALSGTFYNGDGPSVVSGVSLATATGAVATVGTHPITVTGGTAANYAITDVSGTLTVTPAPLTITADNQGKVYGAADPTLTYTPSGTLYYGDQYSVISGVSLATATGAAATVGTHTITATGSTAANYAVTDLGGTFTVTPAPLTVTANNQSKVYGASDPTLTYTPSGTLYYGDQYSVISGVSLSTASGAAATAGTHAITASGGTAANYAVTDAGGVLTVSLAPLTVTADNQSKVYGASNPALTYTPSGTLYYGDQYSVISGVSLSTATGAAATAGTHAITATGGTAANYAVTDLSGTLTVTPAPLTVIAANQSKVYGGSDPTLSYAVSGTFYNGDGPSVVSGVSLATATGAAATAGTHAITATGGTAANYAITDQSGTLTVTPAPLMVTADNQSKIYGGSDPTLTYTPSGTLYYGDQYSVISGVSLATATGAAATAGTHAITASGGTAANYAVTDLSGTLTVAPAPLTVTADNQSRAYGAADPLFTASYGGFQYGQSFASSGLTGAPSLTSNDNSSSPSGNYTITAALGTLSAQNYSVSFVNGTLTVLPAPTFTLTGPSSGAFTPGQSITIGWTAANVDVAGPSTITLGYDPDSTTFDANQHWLEIDQVAAANGTATYVWNTTGVAAGNYYFNGYLFDSSTGLAVYSNLSTPIALTVGAPVLSTAFTLTGPSAGTFTVGQSVTIGWTAANVDLAGPTKITLGYDPDSTAFDANQHWLEVDQVTAANGTATYGWNTAGVAPGTYHLSGYTYDDSTSRAVYSQLSTSIVIMPAPAATFTLTGPSAGTFTAGQNVTIGWTAANVDAAGVSKISLGYDPDSTAFDANQHWLEVDHVTAANGTATYVWNTAGVAAGTYYLSGYLYDDATGRAVYSHLGTSIVIMPVPAATFTLTGPSVGTFTAGQNVTIGWTAANVDAAGVSKIALGYDRDATAFDANQHWIEVDQVVAANGAAGYVWNTAGVANGTYYLSGYIFDFSTGKAVYSHLGASIVIMPGPVSTFALTGPSEGTFTPGQKVTIGWTVADVDTAGVSKITLGYDRDATAFDANQHWLEVDQVTAANGAATYVWNTTSVAAGTYYLSGYMLDFSTDKAIYSHLGTSIVIT